MRILVTGGLGFIGSAVVRQSVNAGHDVFNIDKCTYAGDLRNVEAVSASDLYQLRQIDICDGTGVAQAFRDFRPDRVIHLAAESHVDRSIKGPAEFVRSNVMGTVVLLGQAQAWLAAQPNPNFRFVHVSTDEVFGSLGDTDPPFNPSTAYDPRSPYSASKAASDHFARAWEHTYGLPVVVTNCSNNYGPYQFPEKLIPLMISSALRQQPLPVYGEGKNVRDWLHVEDHATGLLTAALGGTPGETYLFGGNSERTNLEVVHAICDLTDEIAGSSGRPRRELIVHVDDRPGHDHRYAIDFSSTTASLGWQPSREFKAGLSETIRWYIDNANYVEQGPHGPHDNQRSRGSE